MINSHKCEFYFVDMQPIYHTFYKDHLGSNRVVVDQYGKIEQINHYYPFGALMAESTEPKEQQFKYNGKWFEPMSGINLYDYGARQYYAALPTWDRIDPLCEKYYSISPYAYCANNPVNRIDPDGRIIKFAQGTSIAFIKQFENALEYLKKGDGENIISYLKNSETVITISETESLGNYLDNKSLNINWNPFKGLLTTDTGNKLFPAILLYHEMAHVKHKLENPQKYNEDIKDDDSVFQSKEEKSTIQNEETNAAIKLGEIPSDAETSRTDHGGIPFKTDSSTSREIMNPTDEQVYLWIITWCNL